jgi:hypothetical protein
MRGPMWDRLLREYYLERVFVDITVERMAAWPDLGAAGEMEVTGVPWPGAAAPQPPPKNGTGPRVDVDRAAGRIAVLPHRVLAYRGADEFPVVVPVEVAGHDAAGLRWWYRADCFRREAAAQACWPLRTGRSWSGSAPASSPDGWTSAATARRSTRRTRPKVLWHRPARNCYSSPTGSSRSTGRGKHAARETAERLKRLATDPGSP